MEQVFLYFPYNMIYKVFRFIFSGPQNCNLSYFFNIFTICVKFPQDVFTLKKLNNTNLCVNTTNSNYIEKIYKKQVVLKKHSLQSDKVVFCVPIEYRELSKLWP